MDQYQPQRCIPRIGVHTLDWWEIMSSYPFDGVSPLVWGTVQQETLDERVTTCFSGQLDVD